MAIEKHEVEKLQQIDNRLSLRENNGRKEVIREGESGRIHPICTVRGEVDNRVLDNLMAGDIRTQGVEKWAKQFEQPTDDQEYAEAIGDRADMRKWASGRVERMNAPKYTGGFGRNKRGLNV